MTITIALPYAILYGAGLFLLGMIFMDTISASVPNEANAKWHDQKHAYIRYLLWGGLLSLVAIFGVAITDPFLAGLLFVGLLIIVVGVVMRMRRK